MSIKNPLLERYSSQKQGLLLSKSAKPLTSSILKRSPDVQLTQYSKALRPSVLTSSALLSNKSSLLSSNLSKTSTSTSLSYSLPSASLSLSSTVNSESHSLLEKPTVSVSFSDELQEQTSDSVTESSELVPFLDPDNFIPLTVKNDVINNYFETTSKATVVLTKENVLKQDFINLAACSLIHVPKLDNKDDTIRIKLISLAEELVAYDPEFILKTALFTRRVLNIRVTANFLVAFAAFKIDCRRYIKKYYEQIVMLPSDWIDVAELYTSLGDKNIGFSALPVCLRKVMIKKFPSFDEYQVGKYNKKPKKKVTKTVEEEDDNDDTKLYERHHFTLKQLIRKIHMFNPPDIIMPILGKKYPETQEHFYRSRLSGIWDEKRAGKRMKVPTPYTWETQLAANGNNAKTWKELILSRKLPYMAMLRNLRNIIQSGVKDNIHKIVQRKLCSPEDVKRSKQFPFRFLSAYAILDSLKEAKVGQSISWSTTPDFEQDTLLDEYKGCLDKAVQLSAINNVKPIKGSLLIMFCCNLCMDDQCSAKGLGLTRTIREVAGLMTLMCMFSSEYCDVVYYNENGTARGEKIETGGEILKFLSSFVTESKNVNEQIKANGDNYLSINDCWTEIISKERHYDTIIQISHSCDDWRYYRALYREKVNDEVLAVEINLKASKSGLSEGSAHRNDVCLHGFSDQMLQYISERGSGELLSNVESIDKKFNLLPLPKPMAQSYVSPLAKQMTSKVIRIFVSSTFLDLELERKELMNFIIPEINKIVMEKHFTIQEVDLRWGVTKDEAASNKVILRCLEELCRCHYFFCIIGQRYGTTFDSYPKSPNDEFNWLEKESPGLSMTEIEVRHAIFHASSKLPDENMIFLIRQDINNQDKTAKLSKLIRTIENYSENDFSSSKPTLKYYKRFDASDCNFSDMATDALQDTVVKNIMKEIEDNTSDEDMHNSFIEQQALLFVGRQNLITNLVSTIQKEKLVVVTGPGGTGKSALLARALTTFSADDRLNDFHHVVKLNSGSKDLNNLLIRLCFHLSRIINEELDEYFEPITTLWGQIIKCETRFKVVIDGCDELLHSHELFSWLPDNIPPNITVIFTATSPGLWSTYLNKKYPKITSFNVSKLSVTEKAEVTKEMLAAYGKKLEEKGFNSQLSLLLSKREANNPLFIDLCINQLRLNAVFENLTQCIKELPQTTQELHIKMLNLAVKEIGVSEQVLAYLYCSKNGISESDVLLFLQLKPLVLSNLLYYLQLFIHVDQSTGILSLSNQFARKVVLKHCFNEEKLSEVHNELASEYADLITFSSCHYLSGRRDAYQNVLFHYSEAGEWKIIVDVYLSDLNFIRQIVYLGLLNDILSIFNIDATQLKGMDKVSYKNSMNQDVMKYLHQFLINNKNILVKEPYLLQQRMLLQSEYFVDQVENNDDLVFNNFVGCFKSLSETPQVNKCVMNEHSNSVVTCLSACDVSNIVLVGFNDSKFQAINSSSSKILQTYRGHTGPVSCCGFLTSSRFVSAGSDGSLKLWGLLDSVCIATITPHKYQVQDIDVNSITKCVISAGIDRRVTVWHNDVIFDTIEFDHPMNCISFIENGKKFVAGSWTGEVVAYDLVRKIKISVKKSGKVHKSSIRSLTAGKLQFATLDITGIISIWDQSTLDVLKHIRISNITTLSYDNNDNLMYGLNNGIINIASGFGQMSSLTLDDIGAVTSLCCHGSSIIIGYYSGAVQEVDESNTTTELTHHKGKVNSVVILKLDGNDFVVSCSDDGTIHVSKTLGGYIKTLTPHLGKTLALCPGGANVLFSGGYDCAIAATKFDDMNTQDIKLYGHQAPVSTLLALKEGERLVSGSHDGSVKLWNSNTGKCLFTSDNCHTDWVTCSATIVNHSLDCNNFVTGSNDNLVVLWKLERDRIIPINKLLGHSSPVSCVSMLGNEKEGIEMMMGGAQDGSLILWNKDGKFISSTKPGARGVNACTFVPGTHTDPTAYIGTVDGEVKRMKPSKLDVIATFTHHTGTVKKIQNLSGNKISSISADNTIQVWEWSRAGAANKQLHSIADIKWYGNQDLYKIAVLDKTGNIAQWTLQDDSIALNFQHEGPRKARCIGLIPPTETKDAKFCVPEDNKVTSVLCSTKYRIETFSGKNDNRQQYFNHYQTFNAYDINTNKLVNTATMEDLSVVGYMDVTQEGIVMVSNVTGILHLYNMKTDKRMPSSNIIGRDRWGLPDTEYISAATYYNGNNIMGTVSGYIRVPRKKGKELVLKVFNSAVTALGCIVGEDGEMNVFAGSKDGVIKVLTSELKVMGMYHTSGPVTVLRILQLPGQRGDAVYIVAGDKCGCVHFLKWFPPSGDTGDGGEVYVKRSRK